MFPLCRNYPQGMVTPDTETSTRELNSSAKSSSVSAIAPSAGSADFSSDARQSKIGFIEDRRGGRCVSSSVIIILDELLVKWEL